MRYYYSSKAVRAADRVAAEKYKVPGMVLMENAGRGAADYIRNCFPAAKNVTLLCGPGNNGGDGFVAARHLALGGMSPTIVLTSEFDNYQGDARIAADIAFECRIPMLTSAQLSDEDLSSMLALSDVVVDALLGTGSKGAPRGEVMRVISLLNATPADRVVSFDIPSGIDADSGETEGVAVSAAHTVTFLAPKTGLAVTPGALCAGRVDTVDIGIETPEMLPDDAISIRGYDRNDIKQFIPETPTDIHKGQRGALMIIGGSNSYRGAPILAAIAALRSGCGVVYLAVPDFMAAEAAVSVPEAILLPLDEKEGCIRFRSIERVLTPHFDRTDSIVLGPGLGRAGDTDKLVRYIHREWKKPLLCDADALFHLASTAAENKHFPRRANLVITPHIGEAAKLLNSSKEDVIGKRLKSIELLSHKYGVSLLKGPYTLIRDQDDCRVILEGSSALSIPGSGDVLSGVVGAFLAKGLKPIDAATVGALMHGKSPDNIRNRDSANGIMAREIAFNITEEV